MKQLLGCCAAVWAAKIDAVLGDERPIAVENDGLQLPIFSAALTNPNDMRSFSMTPLPSKLNQFLAQTFVHEQLHEASFRRGVRRVEITTDPAGSVGDRRGLPRCGLASA